MNINKMILKILKTNIVLGDKWFLENINFILNNSKIAFFFITNSCFSNKKAKIFVNI